MLTPSVQRKLMSRLGLTDPVAGAGGYIARKAGERVVVRVASALIPVLGPVVAAAFVLGDVYEIGKVISRLREPEGPRRRAR